MRGGEVVVVVKSLLNFFCPKFSQEFPTITFLISLLNHLFLLITLKLSHNLIRNIFPKLLTKDFFFPSHNGQYINDFPYHEMI